VLDKGAGVREIEDLLANAGNFIDLVKIGWGISYVDATAKARVALYQSAGAQVSTGGTLLEIVVAQDRLDAFRRWATELGVDAVEVSDGLAALPPGRKTELVAELSRDFVVLAEVGAKDEDAPVSADAWVREMNADLEAGAQWVIAEGRESGTVGLYDDGGRVRDSLVDALVTALPTDRIIFEAPRKSQQAWFIRRLGSDVNLGNIAPDDVLPLETLRLGLRADTATIHVGTGAR
jgi:phosphosulfolactate synthase